MLRCVSVLLLTVAAIATGLDGHAAQWERLGPEGGRVLALAVAPSNPQVVYAGGAAVFRTADGGLHWSPTADPFPSYGPDAPPPRVTAMAVSPADPNRVLLASPQGLFLTTDGGATWRRAGTINVPISALTFGHGSQRAVASGPNAIYRSLDGGATWSSASAPAMTSLCEDPQSATAFVGALSVPDASGRSLYRSADGLTWTPLPAKDLRPACLRPAPDGAALYAAVAGAGGGVFRVARDGTSVTGLSDTPSLAIAVTGLPGFLFSGSDPACEAASVWRTTDDGAKWQPLVRSFGGCALRSLALGADLTPLAGTDGGILACDALDTWHQRRDGLAMASVTGAWRRDDGTLLFAAALDGLYKSGDEGQTWSLVKAAGRRSLLAVSEARAGRLYYTSSVGLERSDDFGQVWRKVEDGMAGADVARILLHPTKPDTAYAVLADGAVYRTTTSLASWKRILAPYGAPPATAPDLALARSDPDTLYTLRPDGLHASEDGGTTWEPRSVTTPATAHLAVDPLNPQVLFRATTAGTTVSAAKSMDGGRTWSALRQEAGAAASGFSSTFIATDPRRPGRVLLGTNRGLRVSEDYGTSWRSEATGAASGAGAAGTFCSAWAPCGEADDFLATDGAGLLRGRPAPVVRTSDLASAVTILRLALTVVNPTPEQVAFADRDGDGRITRADATLTLRLALGGT